MSVLTTKQRNKLPDSSFALPGKHAYPIPDASHARNALARAAQNASPAEQAEIKRKVHARYPGIDNDDPKARTKHVAHLLAKR